MDGSTRATTFDFQWKIIELCRYDIISLLHLLFLEICKWYTNFHLRFTKKKKNKKKTTTKQYFDDDNLNICFTKEWLIFVPFVVVTFLPSCPLSLPVAKFLTRVTRLVPLGDQEFVWNTWVHPRIYFDSCCLIYS